jgi:hypothetical protein
MRWPSLAFLRMQVSVPVGTGTGPAGTLFYVAFAAFLNYVLLKEMGFLG